MTRDSFIYALRTGLYGLPLSSIDEIVADYEAHFADGLAEGRSEADVAHALGDPRRLARELRAEAGLKRWEEQRNPSAAAGAVFAVFGLATIDILILLPLLIPVAATMFGLFIAAIAVFFAGGWVFGAGLFGYVPGFVGASPIQIALVGIAMMSGAVAGGGILTLAVAWMINALVWYGRLHLKLLKPEGTP